MVSKRQRLIVLWPEYFDSNLTHSQGRKVSSKAGVSNPHLNEIEKALNELNIEYEAEPQAAYPGAWWKKNGRVLVPKKGGREKTKLVKWVARKVKVNRQQ